MSGLDWKLRGVPADVCAAYRAAGWWDDATLGGLIAEGLQRNPCGAFAFRSATRPWRGTAADVLDDGRRVAGGLQLLGIRPGDVVAFQLPNWLEAATTFYASALLGAVVAPVVHFYGAREVGHVLRETRARVFVTYTAFGSLSGTATLASIRESLPDLEHVFVVGDDAGPDAGFDALRAADPVPGPASADPAWPALVAYTSGTTAAPKGVVHTHRSITSEIRQLAAVQPPQAVEALVGAPVGHGIGMLAALLLPLARGREVHLVDAWEPSVVLRAMHDEGLGSGTGATYFLTSLLDHPDLTRRHLELMHFIGLGGAAAPRAVTERASDLGLSVVRLYGSTEHPSVTGCTHDDPRDKRLGTDGRALPGVELRLDDDGQILSRGPDCFAGYVDPAQTAAVIDDHGWYATEDVGVLDDEGYLTITDRLKDIIIRGGENVSAAEVEELLLSMPGVAEVAVVAAPDARLGEHAAALLRLLPGATAPDLPAVRNHLALAGLARQKWPEELHLVPDFPRTASGKVRKAELRARLRAEELTVDAAQT